MYWDLPDQWGLSRHVWIAISGLSPFLGHVFSIFLGLKGGKGVATALGVYLPISAISVLIECLIFLGIVWKWRFISLGSIICAVTIPILIAFFRSESQAYFHCQCYHRRPNPLSTSIQHLKAFTRNRKQMEGLSGIADCRFKIRNLVPRYNLTGY